MKVAYFSTGVPDPMQGGGGILNYYFLHYLLNNGHHVKAFFRVNEAFLKKHATIKHLPALAEKGLAYELVNEDKRRWPLKFGLNFLLQQQQYFVCKKIIDEHGEELKTFDVCFSLDLGWALALKEIPLPKICILGDPLHGRFKYGEQPCYLTPRGLLHLARRLSVNSLPKWYPDLLRGFDDIKNILGCWAPQEVEQYKNWGVPVRHFRSFCPPANVVHKHTPKEGELVALHLGSLYPNASLKMLQYMMKEVFPILSNLPFKLELRFIGKYDPNKVPKSKWENIEFIYLGAVESVNSEFMNADVFLSPMKYPVGIRTRILSALAYGIPVVADFSSASALPELTNGKDIVFTNTPQEIFDCLNTLYKNYDRASKIGVNGRLAWEKYYNPNINVPYLVDSLAKII